MKKFASMLLALAVLFSLAAPAFAANDAVCLSVVGAEKVNTVLSEGTAFVVTAANTDQLATVTIDLTVSGDFADVEIVPAEGWTNISAPLENGKGQVVLFNPQSVTSADATVLFTVYVTVEEAGEVTAKIVNAVLSSYEGEGEKFNDVTFGSKSATTVVEDATAFLPAIIIGGAAGAPSINVPFVDVPVDAWYYNEVAASYAYGLIDGVTATTFMPEKSLTVAEAIKLAAALHQLTNEGKVTLTNGDKNWFDTYVAYAVANGIIEEAYEDYTVEEMNAPIARNEFVHIFHGAMDNYDVINAVGDNNIPDVKLGDAYAAEIYEFYRAGICVGNDQYGTFLPTNSIKRSEVATILYRMYDVNAREIVHLP